MFSRRFILTLLLLSHLVGGERLITTDLLAAQSFDEILAPIRQVFQEANISEGGLDALFEEVRQEVYEERKSKRE